MFNEELNAVKKELTMKNRNLSSPQHPKFSGQGLWARQLKRRIERGMMVRRQNVSIAFYASGLKGSSGASSNWIVRLSVRPSARLSVHNSVPLTNKVQYLKFGSDTVTKLGL